MARQQADTHAGGIVFRRTAEGVEYLIVRSLRDPSAWVLPKGHIDPGETAEQAAAREVEEEAGCRATIVAPLGRMAFGDVRTAIYLMRFDREVACSEDRGIFWGSAEEAGRRLTYHDTRELLAQAHLLVTAAPAPVDDQTGDR